MASERETMLRDLGAHVIRRINLAVHDSFKLLDDDDEALTMITMVLVTIVSQYIELAEDLLPKVFERVPEREKHLLIGSTLARMMPRKGDEIDANPFEIAALLINRSSDLLKALDAARIACGIPIPAELLKQAKAK